MNSQPRTVRRIKASLSGTNLELTGDYNQRLVYQAIRTKGPITRNALIELTGLAKPTIAGIVRRLLGSDLVHETDRIYGGRGQPAVHLEINPQGCYAIGLLVGDDALELVSIDASGTVVQRLSTASSPSSGEQATAVFGTFFEDARLLCRDRIIGLGVVRTGHGLPVVSGEHGIDLSALAAIASGVPIYSDSDLSAATAGESLFGAGGTFQSYYYILMGSSPVGGLVVNQALFKGAHPGKMRRLFPGAEPAWCREMVAAAMSMRRDGQAAVDCDQAWVAAACADLLPLLISINCMLNPGGIILGGQFPQQWLETLATRCNALLLERAPHIPSHAGIQPSQLAGDTVLIGAASLPMRARLYPIEEALMKASDRAG